MNIQTVSVILPIYNVEKYLPKSIESVINQTYKFLEIILVDDGSTDRCPEICDTYAEKDDRIKVIHKENGGLSSARNKGIEYAHGEYIYFLDSDDYIDNDLIEYCVKTIVKHNCDIVVFNHVIEDESENEIGISNFKKQEIITESSIERIKYISDILLRYTVGWNAWNRFYKSDIILNNKLFYPDNNIFFAEDQAFALRVSLFQRKLVVVEKRMYHYLQRTTSIMGSSKKPPLTKFVKLCLNFNDYVNSLDETTISNFNKYKNSIFSRFIINELNYSSENFEDSVARVIELSDNEKDYVIQWLKGAYNLWIFKIKRKTDIVYYLKIKKLLNRITK